VAVVGIMFGLASVGAGFSVLSGRDPGYLVYRPLVAFNTVMGVFYGVAGVLAWRQARATRAVAGAIVGANLLVLVFILFQFREGTAAIESVQAMLLRSGVWLGILLVLLWAQQPHRAHVA
jgi:hypothetical protein